MSAATPATVNARWIRLIAATLALVLLGSGGLWLGMGLRQRLEPNFPSIPPRSLVVNVLSVGNGEAAIVRTPGLKFVVIGTGPTGAGVKVATALRAAGAKRIDLLILPYPYDEAIGGTAEILRRFPCDAAVDSGWPRINNAQETARRALAESRTPVFVGRTGWTKTIDGVRIEILAPPKKIPGRAANGSLVVRLRYKETSFLFCGGIEAIGETMLLSQTIDLSADFLRVARFAGPETVTPAFLRRVSPEFAVISVGARRDLPDPGALTRLNASGVKLFRTDAGDDRLFFSDGQRIVSTR